MKSKIFSGFSLTEVMISMAVVGIIAAITVPVVTNHSQKQAFLTMLQKNYVELDENLSSLQTENIYGGLRRSILARTNADAGNFLRRYYNVKLDCGETAQPCFAAAYSSTDDPATTVNFSCEGYSVTVASGAAICIIPSNEDEDGGLNPATVYIDTNGTEIPNISGRDLFRLFIFEDFTVDEVDPTLLNDVKEATRTTLINDCLTSTDGSGCFSRIYNDNWKMNY